VLGRSKRRQLCRKLSSICGPLATKRRHQLEKRAITVERLEVRIVAETRVVWKAVTRRLAKGRNARTKVTHHSTGRRNQMMGVGTVHERLSWRCLLDRRTRLGGAPFLRVHQRIVPKQHRIGAHGRARFADVATSRWVRTQKPKRQHRYGLSALAGAHTGGDRARQDESSCRNKMRIDLGNVPDCLSNAVANRDATRDPMVHGKW
jgi:hypothetical protein